MFFIFFVGWYGHCTFKYVFCKFLIVFLYYGMVCREHKGVLEDLDKAQVDILHVGSNRKNAADDKLKQLMRRWGNSGVTLCQNNYNWFNRFADLHRDGSRIVLIRWQKINTYESSFEPLMVCCDWSTLNEEDFLKSLVSSHMIPSHSQWRLPSQMILSYFLVVTWILLPTLPTSSEECSSQSFFFTGSMIKYRPCSKQEIWRIQIENTKQSYPLQSQCLRIADKRCFGIPQLPGSFACFELRRKLFPCIFFSNFSLISS